MKLRTLLNRALAPTGYEIARKADGTRFLPDVSEDDARIIERVAAFTMAQNAGRVFAMMDAVRYAVQAGVPGSVVECGVWRGGMMMAAALTLRGMQREDRELYLFDTFTGMTEPGEHDVDSRGKSATTTFRRADRLEDGGTDWCYASLEDVQANLGSTSYPNARVHLVKGRVEDTVPAKAPAQICVLRLDTDWYESTRHEMQHLYPRLQRGGVLILDDYGHWLGSRKAVDEYFQEQGLSLHLVRVDQNSRVAVKL